MIGPFLQTLAVSDPNQSALTDPVGIATQVYARVSEILATFGLKVVGAILIVLVGRWVARLAARLVTRAMGRAKVEPVLVSFADNLIYVGLLALVVVAALEKVGVRTASFAAILAAAGLAVGLALQGSLSNFAAGVLMVIFRPLRVGDFVEVGGEAGTVREVQIFNTILTSPDNVRIIVPNAQVMGGNIKNYTVNGTRRIDLVLGVSYDDDLAAARRIIETVLADEKRVLRDPAPVVAVAELADSSVNFVVRPWVQGSDYWDVRFALIEALKTALEAGGLSIPYPQQDLYLKTPVTLAEVSGRGRARKTTPRTD